MFSKIYNVIKKYIQENLKTIIIYGIILFMILCPVNYYIITGGGSFNALDKVIIKNAYKSKGSFNMAYVSEIKGTVFTYLLSYVIPSYERDSIDDYRANDDEDVKDIDFRNRLWLKQTNNNAIYVAYTNANKEIKEKYKRNYIFNIDEKAKTNLKVGDQILEMDGIKLDSIDDLKKYVNSKNALDKVIFKVKRNGKTCEKYAIIYENDSKLYVGVTLLEDTEYITDPKVKFNFKSSESGPSGGLVMSLQIYNLITKWDITNGLKIVGTGTINKDGSVGSIDGVKYKLNGAVKNRADVFLVPNGKNYSEALKEKKKNNYNIKIIGVNDFNDALNKLKNLKNK